MATSKGELLAALVLIGLLGGCPAVAPITDSAQAKDPAISTKDDVKVDRASPYETEEQQRDREQRERAAKNMADRNKNESPFPGGGMR